MQLCNLHTHTTYCDGKNTPAEMAAAAQKKGFAALGFSAHLAWPFDAGWHIAPRDIPSYIEEVAALKKEYAGRMDVFLGFEADYVSGFLYPERRILARWQPDFIIGSVHFVPTDLGRPAPLLTVDDTAENVRRWLVECFDGDEKRAIRAYFAAVRSMAAECDFDIVGHADLIRRRNKELSFFDEGAAWYRDEARKTAEALAKSGKIVEINTGGIARGSTDTVYPSEEMLYVLCKNGAPITINSDAHAVATLDAAFDEAVRAAKAAGYRATVCLTQDGWKEFPL